MRIREDYGPGECLTRIAPGELRDTTDATPTRGLDRVDQMNASDSLEALLLHIEAASRAEEHRSGLESVLLKRADEFAELRRVRPDLGDALVARIVKVCSREMLLQLERRARNGRDHPDTSGEARAWPEALDLEALAERDPEPPKFIIPDWLPCGYVTLLAGHGGVGKSGIALHLAVCIATGMPFFGMEVQRRRVMYLACEDREGVLHWRLARICSHLGLDLAKLRGWLQVLDLVGRETILWDRNPRTGYTVTPAYGSLSERVKEQSTQVLFVDGVSDAFGGNENARSEVKSYVNSLLALVSPDEGAVHLIGHVNRPTAAGNATTEGYSGSTAWHNAVRARWYLFPETRQGEDGERAERTGDLILELQKSNLGRTDQSMRVTWNETAGMFLGREIIGASASDRAERDRVDREALLAVLASAAAADYVPAATTGRRTAFHVLSVRPGFPGSITSDKSGRRRFWRLVEQLRSMRLIEESSIRRRNRHATAILVPTTE